MKPKSGKAGKAVPPTAPDVAEDADVADPGKVAEIKAAQAEQKEGKYGSPQPAPHKPAAADEGQVVEEGEEEARPTEEKTGWIEIELVGMDDEPIPGETYRITLPDESVAEGALDEKGLARVEGFESGECKVCFPALDREAWEKI
ncbi:MAG: hypothetical protein ACYTDY_18925 [Planctomycetota bacterium]